MNRRQFVGVVSAVGTTAVAGCTGILSDGPEDVTEQYIEAAADGDVEAQEELIHEEAEYASPSEEGFELTINSIERMSIEEVFEEVFEEEPTDEEIEEAESEIEDQVDELDADDHAFVYYDIEADGESEDFYFMLLEDDSEWLIYQ